MNVLATSAGAAGLADVQARVAEIRTRIADVGGFALPPAAAPVAAAPTADGLPAATPAAPGVPASAASYEAATPAGTAAAAGSPGAWAAKLPPAGQRWAAEIEAAATANGIEPALLAALVNHESGFDPSARSHAGAIGLGQLMPGTAAGLGVDPHDPTQNLDGAARYLRSQLDRFGRVDLALAAYNAGPNRVAQAGGVPRIAETQAYVAKVTDTYERWRS